MRMFNYPFVVLLLILFFTACSKSGDEKNKIVAKEESKINYSSSDKPKNKNNVEDDTIESEIEQISNEDVKRSNELAIKKIEEKRINTKKLKEETFTKAILDYYRKVDKRKVFWDIFPQIIYFENKRENVDTRKIDNYNKFVEYGILKKEIITRNERKYISFTVNEIQKIFFADKHSKKTSLYATYDDYEIIIDNYTVPAVKDGFTVIYVSFFAKYLGFADEFYDVKFKQLFREDSNILELVNSKDTPIKSKAVLIKTAKGWIHKEMF